MLNLLKKFFDTRSPAQVTAFGFALVALAGIADYSTGFELSFSIFYLVPVVLVTWYARKSVAVFICCVSALVWFGIELAAIHRYSSELILIWNAVVRLGFFLITMLLVGKLRAFLDSQQTLAMTDALTGLWNARAFKELSMKLVQLAARYDHTIVLGYIDLGKL
jgi:predicted signal transduction protein with EAL and GGDEF domain